MKEKALTKKQIKKMYPDRFSPMYYLWVDWGLMKTFSHPKKEEDNE